MCGAKPGVGIVDVAFPWQAAIEHARRHDRPLCGVMLDREKCFDRLVHTLTLPLQKRHGCPEGVLAARWNFYERLTRRVKLGASYGEETRPTHGALQGCVWSIDGINPLLGVWVRRQLHAIPRWGAGNLLGRLQRRGRDRGRA